MEFNLAYALVAEAAVSEPSRLLAGCLTVSWMCAEGREVKRWSRQSRQRRMKTGEDQ
jgi:hypothetical protein